MIFDWKEALKLGGAACAGMVVAWSVQKYSPRKSNLKKRLDKPDGDYIKTISIKFHPIQKKLIEYTSSLERSLMLSSADQIQFLQHLIKKNRYKVAVDVGVFTGYSSLSFALALPEDGRVEAYDINEEWMKVAESYWTEAGVRQKITSRLAPAVESMERLLAEKGPSSVDLVYIDADKPNYINYYRLARKLVRPGGLIAVDNVLWHGKVYDQSVQDESTIAIRETNRLISEDTGVYSSLLTIGDGIYLAWVK